MSAQPGSDPLSPLCRRFVLHWGEMGSRWGVNRTVAQIHALLFYCGRPMHAEEITELLAVARSNVSTSLRELITINLVRTVHLHADRRDHFETSKDVWELFRTVIRERKMREFDPTVAEGFERRRSVRERTRGRARAGQGDAGADECIVGLGR